jgi:hypothetical protein
MCPCISCSNVDIFEASYGERCGSKPVICLDASVHHEGACEDSMQDKPFSTTTAMFVHKMSACAYHTGHEVDTFKGLCKVPSPCSVIKLLASRLS